jgi:hypothetical protein
MQEVKGTLRSGTSYQGPSIPDKEERVRRAPLEHPVRPTEQEERADADTPSKKSK